MFTRGKGAEIFDEDGKSYIDYVCGVGPVVLGHADPEFNARVTQSLGAGLAFPGYGRPHAKLAERYEREQPGKRVVSFFKTSSEAMTAAIRCAMMMTGRAQLLRCGFLGWHDSLLYNTPNWHEQLDSNKRILTAHHHGFRGVRGEEAVHNWSDLSIDSLQLLLSEHGRSMAVFALDIYQCELMDLDVFRTSIKLCRQHGLIIIFDETKTAGRRSAVGYLSKFDEPADFIVLGKAIGNGAPLSVLLGDEDHLAIYRQARIGGTHSKDLFSISAAGHVIDLMKERGGYQALYLAGLHYCRAFNEAAAAARVSFAVKAVPLFDGALVDFHWSAEFVNQHELRALLIRRLREQGILVLHGHCSFVTVSHCDISVATLGEKMFRALRVWSRSIDSRRNEASSQKW
jgi:glutamate-1-semialdehyde 2,1-aminomutase